MPRGGTRIIDFTSGEHTTSQEWERLVHLHATGANVHQANNLLAALIGARELAEENGWDSRTICLDTQLQIELRVCLFAKRRTDVRSIDAA